MSTKQQSVVDVFLKRDRFLLLLHHSPDGDAVASSLALSLALRSLNKDVDVVCADTIPPTFHFLPSIQTIRRDFLFGDYDVVVTLDCGDSRRTGFSSRLKELVRQKKLILVNIDHHPKNDLHNLATYNYVDYNAPSTSVLVYWIIDRMGIQLNHKLATCLLTGLYTDTGGFKHPNTTPETLSLASHFLSHGARLKDITSHISPLSTVTRLRLWGIALSRIRQHEDLDIISTYLTYDDLQQVGATEKDIGGIAALITTIPSRLAVLVVEMADKSIQVRMRTKDKSINVKNLASYFGGGGQRKSAGFVFAAEKTVVKK